MSDLESDVSLAFIVVAQRRAEKLAISRMGKR